MPPNTTTRVAAALALLAGLSLMGMTVPTNAGKGHQLGLEIMERRNAATFRRWENVPNYAWLHYKKFFKEDYHPDGHRYIGYKFNLYDRAEEKHFFSFDLRIISMKGKDTLSVVREAGWQTEETYYFTRPVYDIEKQIIRVEYSPRDHFTFVVRFDDIAFVADEADE